MSCFHHSIALQVWLGKERDGRDMRGMNYTTIIGGLYPGRCMDGAGCYYGEGGTDELLLAS